MDGDTDDLSRLESMLNAAYDRSEKTLAGLGLLDSWPLLRKGIGMEELERRSKEWHERKFGDVDPIATVDKLQEKVAELDIEIIGNDILRQQNIEHILEEAGDVIMVLSHIIRHYDGTVEGCWRKAIKKCERRERTGER